ncbi:MAG: response regulator transcription factor [Cyanobacteria bacterium J06635_10]
MLMLSCEPSTLRVLVVDDHELTRLSLQIAFSSQENIQVVGMASNGKEALDMVKSCYPDVIVLDLQMPVMDGWSASCKIKDISPKTQIIAYSSVEENYFQDTRATSKVDAFCRKDAPTYELVGLIKQLGESENEP